jgi:hypothetical protein
MVTANEFVFSNSIAEGDENGGESELGKGSFLEVGGG